VHVWRPAALANDLMITSKQAGAYLAEADLSAIPENDNADEVRSIIK
jgi:hypothetical protein